MSENLFIESQHCYQYEQIERVHKLVASCISNVDHYLLRTVIVKILGQELLTCEHIVKLYEDELVWRSGIVQYIHGIKFTGAAKDAGFPPKET